MRDVHVHRILIEDTVESRIVELQERKRETIDTALDEGAARSLSRLGGHELRFLFRKSRRGVELLDESKGS